MDNKYLLKPALGTIKQAFFLEDEANNTIYEGRMIKFKLFGASPFKFKNYITGLEEEHKVGKTVTIEKSGGVLDFLSTRSYFKYDGVKIWDYLHDKGIRINSTVSTNKLGMTYVVTFEGKEIATIATTSPKGKSFVTTNLYYDVICKEKDLDLVFLVAFSIAKTEQIFYN